MVRLHFFQLKMFFAMGAYAFLLFIHFAFHRGRKDADMQVFFFPVQYIRINTFFIGYIIVLDQGGYFFFQGLGVQRRILKFIIQFPPRNAFHLFAVGREGYLHPINHFFKIQPQFAGIGVVLVFGHVDLYVAVGQPFQRRFQILLAYGGARQILPCQAIGRAARFGKITFRVCQPGAVVNGIAQFLFR